MFIIYPMHPQNLGTRPNPNGGEDSRLDLTFSTPDLADRTNIYQELSKTFEESVSNVACRLSDNVNTDVANDKSVNIVANLTVLVGFYSDLQSYYSQRMTRNK